jgi:peptidylprolyl isomerase
MKRFFLFAAALSCTGAFVAASAPTAFAQEPETPPAANAPTKAAQITPEKKKSIEEFIDLSGAVKTTRAAIFQDIDRLQATNPSFPKSVADKMRKRFDERLPQLIELMVPIYDKSFTQEEINTYIAFYKTPAGKKLADNNAPIQQQENVVVSQWGRQIGEEIETEMAAEVKAKSGAAAAGEKKFDTRPFKGNGKPVTTASGLKYEDMTVGTGATAVKGKTAIVHYTGTLTDGTKFDSSRDRNEPFDFPLGAGRVIKGWDEGVAGMKIGGRRRLVIPASLGYGAQGTPGGPIPPNATLIFDVELIGVQ